MTRKLRRKPSPGNKTLLSALKMLSNGYSVIPGRYTSRIPLVKNWPQYEQTLPSEKQVREWFSKERKNTAIVCGRVAAYDIDIDDEDLAKTVQQKIEEITGAKPPVRIGNYPRRTIFFQAAGKSPKTTKTKLGEAGEVELLGAKHTCMVAGIHHITKKPYKWHSDDLTKVKLEELPKLTIEHIEAIDSYLHSIAPQQGFDGGKLKDGREEHLRNLVYKSVQKVLSTTEVEDIDAEQLAKRAWEDFTATVDTSRPKGANSNERYTYNDALQKVRYTIERYKEGNLPTTSTNNETGIYSEYATFLDHHLGEAKKDLISGQFLLPTATGYTDINNMFDVLSSHADETTNISPHRLKAHMARYIHEKQPELLIALPEWDGKDRIKNIVQCLCLKNLSKLHAEELLKDWGANVFRRMHNPKIQNRVLVLQGKQGIGKDSLLREMLDGLQHYYGEMTICNEEKENFMAAAEHAVLCIGEFERVSSKTLASFKHLVTAEQASIRRPYARGTTKHPLRCSFVATSNNKGLLQDATGNRRFIVFELVGIEWSYPQGESLQILAQFKQLADSNYSTSTEAEKALQVYLRQHTPDNPETLVVELFDAEMQKQFKETGIKEITFADAQEMFTRIGKRTGQHINKVAEILNMYDRRKHTRNGRIYFLPDKPKPKRKLRLRRKNTNHVKGVKGKTGKKLESRVGKKEKVRILAK